MMPSRVMESEVPMMSSMVMEPEGNETECAAGEELMRGSCVPCRSGFYKSQAGNETCSTCPANTDTNGETGSTECSQYLLRHITVPIGRSGGGGGGRLLEDQHFINFENLTESCCSKGRRPPTEIRRSATVNLSCRCRIICCVLTFLRNSP